MARLRVSPPALSVDALLSPSPPHWVSGVGGATGLDLSPVDGGTTVVVQGGRVILETKEPGPGQS